MAVLSFASRSSYVPWKIASTSMPLPLSLKLFTIRLIASPFTPDIACHHVIFVAGLTSLPGACALRSCAPPPVPPPPHATATMASAKANAVSLLMSPPCASPAYESYDRGSRDAVLVPCSSALYRASGQATDELALADHEECKRRQGDHHDAGHDEALIRVEPPDRSDGDVVRDDRRFPRDHECREEHEEEHRPAAELHEREREGGEARGYQLTDHHDRRDDKAVEQIAADRDRLQHLLVVVERRILRQDRWRERDDVALGHERVRDRD